VGHFISLPIQYHELLVLQYGNTNLVSMGSIQNAIFLAKKRGMKTANHLQIGVRTHTPVHGVYPADWCACLHTKNMWS
jgi:hypothetical protein